MFVSLFEVTELRGVVFPLLLLRSPPRDLLSGLPVLGGALSKIFRVLSRQDSKNSRALFKTKIEK